MLEPIKMDFIPVNPRRIIDGGKKIPVLSFFTGGGFLDLGFELAGFKIVWTNECSLVFKEMYEYGMTAWRRSSGVDAIAKISDCRSIEEIPADDIIKKAFPHGRPPLFGAIGGPPCPDFARGGKNRGDKGNHGVLSKIYVDRICEIKPDFFVFENVSGLLRTKKHRAFLDELEAQLEENGYSLDLKILSALEFGVPQDRERLIFIGIMQNLLEASLSRVLGEKERRWFPFPECPEYKDAKTRFNWPAVEPPGKIPEKPTGIPDELMVYSILDGCDPPSKQPNGLEVFKPYSDKFATVCEGDDRRKSFKRLHRYRYSPTACYGHNEVHLHPWENRRLTVREAMRIQGIPDSYPLLPEKSLTAKYALIGNGVPVPLAYRVAVSLYEFLQKVLNKECSLRS
ncbi:MAG: DNA cytosine methyltransferase [Methanophagales archaeon ANME-1-THS]|nr:MAG: DNA cytosine methyltransferase [Methanophagales archaeon ANME-1-THS]